MNSATVGQRIARARKELGLSQGELAQLTGFKTQSGIGNLENRKDGRGGFSLPRIAIQLRVPVEWLLNGPDEGAVPFITNEAKSRGVAVHPKIASASKKATADVQRATEILHALGPDAVREALAFLEFLFTKQSGAGSNGADHPFPRGKRKAA